MKNETQDRLRDLLWGLIAAPFRAGPYVLKLGFFFLIVAIALFLARDSFWKQSACNRATCFGSPPMW